MCSSDLWAAARLGVVTALSELAVVVATGCAGTASAHGRIGDAVARGALAEGTAWVLTGATLAGVVFAIAPFAVLAARGRETGQRLASQERRFRRHFHQAAVGQLALRPAGTGLLVADLNDAAARVLGRPREAILGTGIEQHLQGRALSTAVHAVATGSVAAQRVQADAVAQPARVDLSLSRVSGRGEQPLFAGHLIDVTPEYDARRRSEAAEKLTGTTLDTTACLILVTDLEGRIIRVNAATSAVTGFPASELIGRPVQRTTLAPDDPADLDALFLWPNRSGAPVRREGDVVTRDGRRRRIVWTSNMVRDERGLPAFAVMTGIDVTDERASAGLVAQLMQASVTTALIGVDPEGLITVFNSGAQRLLDLEAAEQIGRPFTDLFDPVQLLERTGAASPAEAFAVLTDDLRRDGELPLRDWIWRDRTGEARLVTMALSVAEPTSGTGGGTMLCVARDVTEQRRSQELLVAALEKERTAVERLKLLDDARNGFVSTVSHELRTPVTSILGYTEMLLDGSVLEPDPEQLPLLETIRRNGRRLIDLCEDLLTLSGLDADSVTWEVEQIDLTRLLRAGVETLAPLLASRELDLQLGSETGPVVVDGDGPQLERVVLNLLSNAVKFTPDGGTVRAWVEDDGESARLVVADSGIGIPLEEQDRLFQRFFRSSTAQREAIQGTGLGLSIVQSIVAAHGGEVRVRSQEGEGSTFTVVLPLARR